MYKLVFFFGLIFLANHVSLAAVEFVSHDSDIYYSTGANVPSFGPTENLLPMFDMYSYWDTVNIDAYGFDFSLLPASLGITLLPSTDCGFTVPFEGLLTSKFGQRWGRHHNGVDIDLETGDTVMAAFDGVVRVSGYNPGGFGNFVIIRHYNGIETLYGHLSQRDVKCGDLVNSGQTIGLGGSTGHSTGSHLHFETRLYGKPFDPTSIISFDSGWVVSDTVSIEKENFANKNRTADVHGTHHKKAPVAGKYHKVKSGEGLYGIARRYHLTVVQLKKMNGLRGNTINPGKRLRVR